MRNYSKELYQSQQYESSKIVKLISWVQNGFDKIWLNLKMRLFWTWFKSSIFWMQGSEKYTALRNDLNLRRFAFGHCTMFLMVLHICFCGSNMNLSFDCSNLQLYFQQFSDFCLQMNWTKPNLCAQVLVISKF